MRFLHSLPTFFHSTCVLLVLFMATSCGGGEKVVALKDAVPPGPALKEGLQLDERNSDSYPVKVAKGEEQQKPEMSGRFDLIYGPGDGATWLIVVLRYEPTIESAKKEYEKIKKLSQNVEELKGLGDEAFTYKGSIQDREVRFRLGNLVVLVNDNRGTLEDSIAAAKRYVAYVKSK